MKINDDELTDDSSTNQIVSTPPSIISTTTRAKDKAKWMLQKLTKILTPNRRPSVAYTQVNNTNDDDDELNDQQSPSNNIEMTGIVLEDVDLNEAHLSRNTTEEEEIITGISVALDLPPPWEISSSSSTTTSNSKNNSSSSSTNTTKQFGYKDGMQIIPTLLLASIALAVTGSVLDKAQHWAVFEARTAYFVAMPMLFGIKGNLDMTLASRLTSALHSGELTGNNRNDTGEQKINFLFFEFKYLTVLTYFIFFHLQILSRSY